MPAADTRLDLPVKGMHCAGCVGCSARYRATHAASTEATYSASKRRLSR